MFFNFILVIFPGVQERLSCCNSKPQSFVGLMVAGRLQGIVTIEFLPM